ncbi:MAG: hypothetical protein Q7S59_10320 [Sulfurimonas sp.]|nr:hypothetical protein [Sulfurimonas sp.]
MTKIENIKLQIELFNEAYPALAKKTTLNQEGAAKFLSCSPNTVKTYCDQGIGPNYSQPGGEDSRVFYTKIALAEWLIDTRIKTA